MLNVGLTGGIATGKSTVAKMLSDKGAVLIDFDGLCHAAENPGTDVWRQIVCHFGEEILQADRTIDRRRLGEIVFAHQEKLALLNRIVHPVVIAQWRRRLEEIRQSQPQAIVVSDIPLLLEAGMKAMVDLVLLVTIPAEAQIARLMARNGCTREEACQRLACQMPIDEKLPLADIVVGNEGSPEETRRRLDGLWMELVGREKALREGEGGCSE
jgi:dephospho-CoA kinase